MKEACRVMKLGGLVRQGIKLIKGLRLDLQNSCFSIAVVSVIPLIKVSEQYASLPACQHGTPFAMHCGSHCDCNYISEETHQGALWPDLRSAVAIRLARGMTSRMG